MRIFLGTTFAWKDESLGMRLSYMALVSASVRLPEVRIVFVGPGGEGEALLLCDLIGEVWGYRPLCCASVYPTDCRGVPEARTPLQRHEMDIFRRE